MLPWVKSLVANWDQAFKFGLLDAEFQVESLPALSGRTLFAEFRRQHLPAHDPVLDYFDPGCGFRGDLTQALTQAKCKFLVIAFSTDWRFSPERSEELVSGAGRRQ